MPKFNSVDILKLAKSGFYFNSNRLDYLGKILGFGGKEDTGGFGLWKGVMGGEAQSLKDMVSYCERDVVLLEKVHQSLAAYTPHRTHAGVLNGGYKYHCPKCAGENTKRNRMKITAMGTTQVQMLCYDCKAAKRGGWFTISEAAYRAYIKEQKAKAAKNKV